MLVQIEKGKNLTKKKTEIQHTRLVSDNEFIVTLYGKGISHIRINFVYLQCLEKPHKPSLPRL